MYKFPKGFLDIILDKCSKTHTLDFRDVIYKLEGDEYLKQVNQKTKISFVSQRTVYLAAHKIIPEKREVVKKRIPIKWDWSWNGFIALLWRIWQAFIEEAPDKGYKYIYVEKKVSAAVENKTRTIELQQLHYWDGGFGGSINMWLGYDNIDDVLYILNENR